MQLNIMQWNCRSLKAKWPDVTQFLSINNISIGLLQETWLNKNTKIADSNFNILYVNRFDGYGGVATIIHKSIDFEKVMEFNDKNIQVLIIKVLITKDPIYIYNVYCSEGKIDSNFWRNVIFSQDNEFSLISGDFNAHHPFWFSQSANTRGNDIYREYSRSSFILINDDS
jgi:exonuclease III